MTKTHHSPELSFTDNPGPLRAAEDGAEARAPGERYADPGAGIDFVWIPPGAFVMGSPADETGRFDDEELPHETVIHRGFWLGRTAVTQGQWLAVMGNNPSYFRQAGAAAPVEQVSWDDCQEFVSRLTGGEGGAVYRLPSEAEWEYACRAETRGPFYAPVEEYGTANCNLGHPDPGLPSLDAIAWWCGNSGGKTHPVAEKKPNPWGLFDMLGNVWEWCAISPSSGVAGGEADAAGSPCGAIQAIRGGPWYGFARCVRCADRHPVSPGFRSSGLGFRLVRVPTR